MLSSFFALKPGTGIKTGDRRFPFCNREGRQVIKNPDLMFRAAWLWMEAERPKNALPLPRILAKKKKPKIDWLMTLSNTCLALEHMKEADRVMDRVIARDVKPVYLYNGGVLRPWADAPDRAMPHLQRLPRPPWPMGAVKQHFCGFTSPLAHFFPPQ